MMTASEFVDAHGGPKAVADRTGRQPGAVSLWKNRNRLPREAWPEIIKGFPDVSLDDLLAIEKASEPVEAKEQMDDVLRGVG